MFAKSAARTRLTKAFLGSVMAALCLGVPVGAQATAIDLLKIPSVQAPKAARALALNITSRGNQVLAVGERGIILRTTVGAAAPEGAVTDLEGRWWLQAKVPVSVNLTAAAFASDTVLFAVGHDGVILKSENAGATWALQFDGNDANEQVLAAAKRRLDAFEARVEEVRSSMPESPSEDQQAVMDELQAKLEEEVFSFEDAEAGARFGPARPMLDVWFKDENTGWVVGSYGQIFQTTDGGDNWELIATRLDNSDYRHYNGLYGDETGLMVIAGESGRVFVSENFGETWVRHETGYIGHLYGVAVTRNSEGQPTILAYGFGGNVFRLGAGADKWWQLKSPTDKSIVGAVVSDGAVLMVDQLGRILKTDPSGTRLSMVNNREGASVTGMTAVNGQLLVSGQGGLRAIAVGSK